MKVLISGGNGKFSKELQNWGDKPNGHTLIPLSKKQMDITSIESIEKNILKYKPDIFIHTAALARPMDLNDKYPEKSIQINIMGTSNCVLMCMKYNVKFIYISTDYVYPGNFGNYSETSGVYPVNKYAWSKLGGECATMLYDNSLILRCSMTEEPFPHERAFYDLYKSTIWMSDVARIVLNLLDLDITGIYNIGGERQSIYNFAKKKNVKLKEITKQGIPNMPDDISMNISKLNNINYD